MKPFVKWAGGKRQLLPILLKNLPKNINQKSTYIEPFLGGGALLLELLKRFKFEKIIANDINQALIECYKIIAKNPEKLISDLQNLEQKYLSKSDLEREKMFYDLRNEFNHNTCPELFIFLNKTCFNGLFRMNKKGEFNVPFGRYKNPAICDKENILQLHSVLKHVTFLSTDFKNLSRHISADTFIYFDPPYRPLTATSSFTNYFNSVFDDEAQRKLAQFFKNATNLGAACMLSNSDPKNTDENDEFFDELYKGFRIQRVSATRAINAKASCRGIINELLITNYKEIL